MAFQRLRGESLGARILRGSAFTLLAFGGERGLRFASNIILTRILFPEAFGMMVLVQAIIYGLEMFSDTGVNASIIQSKRAPPSCRVASSTGRYRREETPWSRSSGTSSPGGT